MRPEPWVSEGPRATHFEIEEICRWLRSLDARGHYGTIRLKFQGHVVEVGDDSVRKPWESLPSSETVGR